MFSSLINWLSNVKNKFFRKVLEIIAGIDIRAQLPKYNSETFSNFFKKNINKINYENKKSDIKL